MINTGSRDSTCGGPPVTVRPANRFGHRSVGAAMRARRLIFLALVAPFFLAGCGKGKY